MAPKSCLGELSWSPSVVEEANLLEVEAGSTKQGVSTGPPCNQKAKRRQSIPISALFLGLQLLQNYP